VKTPEGTWVVLEKDYWFSRTTVYRAGTLGIVRKEDYRLEPGYDWVVFPNIPRYSGDTELRGAWIRPHEYRHASLLEVMSGGITSIDIDPNNDEGKKIMAELRREVELARKEKAQLAKRRKKTKLR
jgi:hypothetical protein